MSTLNRILNLFVVVTLGVTFGAGRVQALTAAEIATFLGGLESRIDLSRAHVSVVDLRDPDRPIRAGLRDDWIVPAASVIKLAPLAEAHRAAVEDRVSLDRRVRIADRNWTGTWAPPGDPFPAIRRGATWSVRDLLEVMIRRSDNVATNTLIDVYRREKITAYMGRIGCPRTLVRHKLSSGIDVVDGEATGNNAMPPRDAARILTLVATGKLVNADASRAMLATLRAQLDRDLIAAALPAGARYAGKTGSISAGRNDAAIVEAPGRKYVLVVYTRLADAAAKPIIRAVAREVDAFFVRTPRNGGAAVPALAMAEPAAGASVRNPVRLRADISRLGAAAARVASVQFKAEGRFDLGRATAASQFALTYRFANLGLRQVVATAYDAAGHVVGETSVAFRVTE